MILTILVFGALVRRRLGWVSPLGPISVAVLSIGAVWGGGLEQRAGIRVVGAIQPGLPPLTVRSRGAPWTLTEERCAPQGRLSPWA